MTFTTAMRRKTKEEGCFKVTIHVKMRLMMLWDAFKALLAILKTVNCECEFF